jgi:hypothetical protein
MTQISGPPIADRTGHRIVTYNFSKVDDLDESRGAHFNWKHRFSNQPAANFKTGLRYRGEEREPGRGAAVHLRGPRWYRRAQSGDRYQRRQRRSSPIRIVVAHRSQVADLTYFNRQFISGTLH